MGSSPFDAHSPEAQAIADLFTQTLVVCGVIGLAVTVLVVTCIVRFRGREGDAEPAQTHGHTRLEIAWTLLPFAIVVGLFALTVHAAGASDPPPDREPDLVVVGHQWWWEARYASGAITANEIHIPVGKKLLVRIESADVIHDFWVPSLGRKIDAVPAHPSLIWISADEAGDYLGACAEYCGAEHAWMRILVVAEPEAAFAAWEKRQLEPAPAAASAAAARGEQLFATKTCIQCHAVTGLPPRALADPSKAGALARVAPDLTHFGGRRTLGAGVAPNDAKSLARWLASPQDVKPASHMPDLNMTDAEVDDLVAWFGTLQ